MNAPLDLLRQVHARNPDPVNTSRLAEGLLNTGGHDEVRTLLGGLLNTHPRHLTGWLLLARAETETGRIEESRRAWENAWRIDRRSPAVLRGISQALERQQYLREAMARLRDLQTFEPSDPTVAQEIEKLRQRLNASSRLSSGESGALNLGDGGSPSILAAVAAPGTLADVTFADFGDNFFPQGPPSFGVPGAETGEFDVTAPSTQFPSARPLPIAPVAAHQSAPPPLSVRDFAPPSFSSSFSAPPESPTTPDLPTGPGSSSGRLSPVDSTMATLEMFGTFPPVTTPAPPIHVGQPALVTPPEHPVTPTNRGSGTLPDRGADVTGDDIAGRLDDLFGETGFPAGKELGISAPSRIPGSRSVGDDGADRLEGLLAENDLAGLSGTQPSIPGSHGRQSASTSRPEVVGSDIADRLNNILGGEPLAPLASTPPRTADVAAPRGDVTGDDVASRLESLFGASNPPPSALASSPHPLPTTSTFVAPLLPPQAVIGDDIDLRLDEIFGSDEGPLTELQRESGQPMRANPAVPPSPTPGAPRDRVTGEDVLERLEDLFGESDLSVPTSGDRTETLEFASWNLPSPIKASEPPPAPSPFFPTGQGETDNSLARTSAYGFGILGNNPGTGEIHRVGASEAVADSQRTQVFARSNESPLLSPVGDSDETHDTLEIIGFAPPHATGASPRLTEPEDVDSQLDELFASSEFHPGTGSTMKLKVSGDDVGQRLDNLFGLENLPSQEDALAGVPTVMLAEEYLRQGYRDQAIYVYRQLLAAAPGDERLRQRLSEIGALPPGFRTN